MEKDNQKNGVKKGITKKWILLAGILLVTAIAYLPSLENSFVNWDDPKYLLENPITWDLTAENVKEIFFFKDLEGRSYVPLSQLSFATENHFVRPDYKNLNKFYEYARPMHINNLILHLLNTALVFILVFTLAEKRLAPAVIVSVFFGVHPMHVESVAWVTERKDVLYTFFFLISILLFLRWQEKNFTWKIYLYSLLFFVAAMLAKSAAVSLPVVLGLIIYWQTGKIDKKDIVSIFPYMILGFIHGVITVMAVKSMNGIADSFTLIDRIMFASYGAVMYLVKFFVPYSLSSYYPYPAIVDGRYPLIFFAAPFITIILFALVLFSHKLSRLFVFGFLFYMATIALMLQLISVGPNIMCERYTYVPYIGLLFIAGMGYDIVSRHKKTKRFMWVLSCILGTGVITFTYLTYERCKIWENSETLWTDVIEKYPYRVPVAYKNRGNYYGKRYQFNSAMADYNVFLQLEQNDAGVYVNRGNIYGLQGQHEKAITDFTRAIEIEPDNSYALTNRGISHAILKQYEPALADYESAISAEPDKWLEIYRNRGFTLIEAGRFDEAISDYNRILGAAPSDFEAYTYRAMIYYNKGDFHQSLDDCNTALSVNPNDSSAYYYRSLSHYKLGNRQQALQDALTAQKLGFAIDQSYIQRLQHQNRLK